MIIDYNAQKDFWDNKVDQFDNDIRSGMLISNPFRANYRMYAEEVHFLKFVSLQKDMKVLDLGCGTGRWSFFMSNFVKHVTAVDISDKMINVANSNKKELNKKNINFSVANITNFTTPQKFDLIHLGSFLQYIDDKDYSRLISNVCSMLTTKGVILTRDTISLTGKTIYNNTKDYSVIYRTPEELIAPFNNNGLKLIYSKISWFVPFFTFTLQKRIFNKMTLKTAVKLSKFTYVFDKIANMLVKDKNKSHNFYYFKKI